MRFETISFESIKSISQRGLLRHWAKLAAGRRFPPLQEFSSDPRMHDPKQLVVWQVENDSGGRRLRALYQGEHLEQVFNNDWAGRTMEDITPGRLKAYTFKTANHCIDSGCAVYSVLATPDAAGQRVDCERLLLPFGDGAGVRHVLASLQLISLTGDFERKSVLTHFKMQSEVVLAGTIASHAVHQPSLAKPSLTASGNGSRRADIA
jgi:hypothetical protein